MHVSEICKLSSFQYYTELLLHTQINIYLGENYKIYVI